MSRGFRELCALLPCWPCLHEYRTVKDTTLVISTKGGCFEALISRTGLESIVEFQESDNEHTGLPDEMFDALVCEFVVFPTTEHTHGSDLRRSSNSNRTTTTPTPTKRILSVRLRSRVKCPAEEEGEGSAVP